MCIYMYCIFLMIRIKLNALISSGTNCLEYVNYRII